MIEFIGYILYAMFIVFNLVICWIIGFAYYTKRTLPHKLDWGIPVKVYTYMAAIPALFITSVLIYPYEFFAGRK